MLWLKTKHGSRPSATPQCMALISAACLFIAGCGEDKAAPDHSNITPLPTSTSAQTPIQPEPGDDNARYWILLDGIMENLDNTAEDYEQAQLFEAVVVEISDRPNEISIPVIQAGIDPRFYLSLRLVTAPAMVPEWEVGDVITFHIHSPSMLFQDSFGESYVGLETRFAITRHPSEGTAFIYRAPKRDAAQD